MIEFTKKQIILLALALPLALLLYFIVYNLIQANLSQNYEREIADAEEHLRIRGFISSLPLQPKFTEADAEFYYRKTPCLKVFNKVIGKFEGVNVEKISNAKDEMNIPKLVMRGNADFYDKEGIVHSRVQEIEISGEIACSERLLMSNLCRYFNNIPAPCENLNSTKKFTNIGLSIERDNTCYDCCNVESYQNDSIVNKYWCGRPCPRIIGFSEERSIEKFRVCWKGSCKTNKNDVSCCKPSDCVYNSACLPPLALIDIDSDNHKEVCLNTNNSGKWIDPDEDSFACINSDNFWISSEEGLCCGDDLGEFFLAGRDDTVACCSRENDLVVGGKCHKFVACGNNEIERPEQCEGPGTSNSRFCKQEEEACSGNRLGSREQLGNCNSNCLCEESNFTFACVKGKCGASCSVDNDCDGNKVCDKNSCGCREPNYCGDGVKQIISNIIEREQCELPDTEKNEFCSIFCSGLKSRIGDSLGSCTDSCQCNFEQSHTCVKNVCGAECNQDGSDCSGDYHCNTDDCRCYMSCGDGKLNFGETCLSCPLDCPNRICPNKVNIILDKKYYEPNDKIVINVTIQDKNNSIMPLVGFFADVYLDGYHYGYTPFKTPANGIFSLPTDYGKLVPPGYLSIYVSTNVKGCLDITGSFTSKILREKIS